MLSNARDRGPSLNFNPNPVSRGEAIYLMSVSLRLLVSSKLWKKFYGLCLRKMAALHPDRLEKIRVNGYSASMD
jgi:hypothetical protein